LTTRGYGLGPFDPDKNVLVRRTIDRIAAVKAFYDRYGTHSVGGGLTGTAELGSFVGGASATGSFGAALFSGNGNPEVSGFVSGGSWAGANGNGGMVLGSTVSAGFFVFASNAKRARTLKGLSSK
jgi:hypothetical protein